MPKRFRVCEVVEEMIQQKLQVLCSVIRTEEEARSSIPYASYVVVVLSRGLLREPHFAMIMLESYLQFKGWGGSTPGGSRSRTDTPAGEFGQAMNGGHLQMQAGSQLPEQGT